MSSSFSDQPSPHDPGRDEGYTTEPRRRQTPDDLDDAGPPRLDSLAQKARGKELNNAKRILIVVGVLTVILYGIQLAMVRSEVEKEVDKQVLAAGGMARTGVNQAQLRALVDQAMVIAYVILGVFIGLGCLFVIFGLIVHLYPIPVTILSLVLYLLGSILPALLAPETLLYGIIFKIIIVVALAKAVQAAIAYERERRESAEFEPA